MLKLGGAILAGGESRRMGKDKGTLLFEGKSFLEHLMNSMNEYFAETLVVGRNEVFFPIQRGTTVLKDLYPGMGPLGGIYTALSFCESAALLFVPCDMPLVKESIYRKFENKVEEEPESLWGLRLEGEKKAETFPLLVPRQCGEQVKQLWQQGKRAMQDLLNTTKVREIPISIEEREWLRSVNTPAEYGELQEMES